MLMHPSTRQSAPLTSMRRRPASAILSSVASLLLGFQHRLRGAGDGQVLLVSGLDRGRPALDVANIHRGTGCRPALQAASSPFDLGGAQSRPRHRARDYVYDAHGQNPPLLLSERAEILQRHRPISTLQLVNELQQTPVQRQVDPQARALAYGRAHLAVDLGPPAPDREVPPDACPGLELSLVVRRRAFHGGPPVTVPKL